MHLNILDNKRLKAGGIYFAANVFNKAIAFITIPIFSRLLTTSEYGMVSTYSAYVMILQYFMGLASEYTVRNAYVDFKNEISQYMASMYLLASCCSLFISFIVIGINGFGLHIVTTSICICCLIQSFMTYVNNAMLNKLMMEEAYIKRAVILAGPNLLSAILGIIFIFVIPQDKVFGRIAGYVMATTIFGIACLIRCWRFTFFKGVMKYWNYILRISPPLILHGLSVIVLSQVDRIMITAMVSSAETGIYSIIYSLSMVAMAVTSAAEGIWTPWFTQKYFKGEYEKINSKARQYLTLVSVLMMGIMLVAPEILKFMTPKSYWSGIRMIPPLVLASYFIYLYSFYINLELLEKNSKRIATITVIVASVNIVLNYVLIPNFGGLAAAWTTLISYALCFGLHRRNGKRINSKVLPLSIFGVSAVIQIMAILVFYIAVDIPFIRWSSALIIAGVILYKWEFPLLHTKSDRRQDK